jgi:hypothetical protein
MNRVFHNAQHWHLFLLTFGVSFFMMIIMFVYMISQITFSFERQQIPDFSFLFLIIGFFTAFIAFVQYGWMWSISVGMKHLLPKNAGLNDLWFKLSLLAIVLYQAYNLYVLFEMSATFSDLASGRNPMNIALKMMSFQRYSVMLLPLTLAMLFFQCYLFYFCAKTLKSIELNRPTDVGDYIGYFFAFMYSIVGFWIIQPKVNRIMRGDWTPPPSYNVIDDPNPTFDPVPEKEKYPRGELLKTKNHEAFDHEDDFDGLF